jgi:Helix-turn-helix family
MRPDRARRLWQWLETLNAVAYFTPECREAPTRLGLAGFWMGYFACRAAPMGAVGAGVVEATFYNFHAARVGRAIPEAWGRTTPAAVLDARGAAAATALRRLLPDSGADRLAAAVSSELRAAIERAVPAGRPLFAANAEVPPPDDPVAALWLAATTLREHRGDSHVALLAAAGLDGCEVHVLAAAVNGASPDLYQQSRGWTADDWGAAVERLAARGLVHTDGTATAAGRAEHAAIEGRTDELAAAPYAAAGDTTVDALIAQLEPAAHTVAGAHEITFPNPMGLPPPD